jgi:hypothetical protein
MGSLSIIVTIGSLLTGAFHKKHLLILAVVLGAGLYLGQQFKTWNVFHYWLGSKYFYALGYDGLYPCAVDWMPNNYAEYATDVNTYEWVPVDQLGGCPKMDSYGPVSFVHFVTDYQGLIVNQRMPSNVLLDKGLNTTPFWMFFSENVAVRGLFRYGLYVDIVLIVFGLAAVYWAYGKQVTGMTALFVLGYWGTFGQIYGQWFQYPWLAALLVAMAAWKKERFTLAGLALAVAIGLRVFPAFLLVGLLFKWKQVDRRFWVGLVSGLALAFVMGMLTSRGPVAWSEWFEKIAVHSGKLVNLALNIGARNMIYTLINPGQVAALFTDFHTGQVRGNYPLEGMVIVNAICGPLVFLATIIACKRKTLSSGLPLLFSALVLSSYYWLVLVVALLEDEKARPWIMYISALGLFVFWMDWLIGWMIFQACLFVWLFAHYGKGLFNVAIWKRRLQFTT